MKKQKKQEIIHPCWRHGKSILLTSVLSELTQAQDVEVLDAGH